MKFVKILVLMLATAAALPSCSVTSAQTPVVQVSWTNPATRLDGSPFDANTEQGSTVIAWGTTKGGPYPNQTTAQGAATSLTVTYPGTPGSYYFVAATADKAGNMGAVSAEVVKTVTSPPGAPSNLTIK